MLPGPQDPILAGGKQKGVAQDPQDLSCPQTGAAPLLLATSWRLNTSALRLWLKLLDLPARCWELSIPSFPSGEKGNQKQ